MIFFILCILSCQFSSALSARFDLGKRQVDSRVTTCGYANGDGTQPRTAGPGDDCRIDTINGLWGFCPNTVRIAVDCGLAGFCIDSFSCSNGCGPLPEKAGATTFTCDSTSYCIMEDLTQAVDQTYTYVRCGPNATTIHLLAASTLAVSSSASQTSSSSSSPPTTTSDTTAAPASSPTTAGPPSTSTPISLSPSFTSQETKQSSTGAIVGGVLGGIALICATIFGIFFMRRHRADSAEKTAFAGQAYTDSAIGGYDTKAAPLANNWDSSYGPAELSGNHLEQIEPVELPDRQSLAPGREVVGH